MRAIRYMLQVGTFLFFAAYLLCLVSGRSFRLPELPALVNPRERTSEAVRVRPSPIEMLKRTSDGSAVR